MALTDRQAFDKLEILEDGQIHVRRARVILDDGVEIARQYSRAVFIPTMDPQTIPNPRLRAIALVVWDPATVAAFVAAQQRGR